MKVAQLIEALKAMPQDANVHLGSHDGATDPPLHEVFGDWFLCVEDDTKETGLDAPQKFVVFLNPDFESGEGFKPSEVIARRG